MSDQVTFGAVWTDDRREVEVGCLGSSETRLVTHLFVGPREARAVVQLAGGQWGDVDLEKVADFVTERSAS